MSLFRKLFGTAKKINVQFIDLSTGDTIGRSEMTANQLPETFSLATTMHIHGDDWSVEEAIPAHAVEFTVTKSLILKMRKVEYLNLNDLLFSLPTISNELPEMTSKPLFTDFEMTMNEDDWRQNEFLNQSSLPLIEIELSNIQDIWDSHSKEIDTTIRAFDKCHVRETIGDPILLLDLNQLQQLLNTNKLGSIKIGEQYVSNGFSIQTEHTEYYGIVEHHKITQLGVCRFTDQSIEEIHSIANSFHLIFVNWYHGEIIIGNN